MHPCLAFLRRNLDTQSYLTMDFGALIYMRPIWSMRPRFGTLLQTTKFTKLDEVVQRRAARFTLNRYHNTSSVNNLLSEIDWPTLQKRRENVRLTMMYKIHNNLAHRPAQDYIMQATQATRNSQPHSQVSGAVLQN